jgi:hypothetical protein
MGAQYQTQMLLEIAGDASSAMSFGPRDAVLFIAARTGIINIGGKHFRANARDGIYVRPSECFRATPEPGEILKIFVLVSPLAEICWHEEMSNNLISTYSLHSGWFRPTGNGARRWAQGTSNAWWTAALGHR